MDPLLRWLRFNLVGAIGMAVQLVTLALLNHCFPHHYLFASSIAVEITILHNFVWHSHYTWRDRHQPAFWHHQLLRFHLANGLISLLGNLILMHLLVHRARLPVLAANPISILCCSIANFLLGNRWAFAIPETSEKCPA
jgi:putative flippase GtrA